MPRVCRVCTHEKAEEINKALVDGASMREISALYRVSEDSLLRHKQSHLPAALAKAKDAGDILHGDDLMGELHRIRERVNLLFDACDRWLRDPDDPTRYEIGPRAEDINVTYTHQVEGKKGDLITIRKKEKLSTLLKRVNDHHGSGLEFELVETKHADPRDLVLKAAERLQDQLELIARLMGELKEPAPTVNVLIASPEWITTRTAIFAALQPYPQAKLDVSKALAQVEHASR